MLKYAVLIPYLIFVTFFTPTYFEAWKFYTQKCVNLRQILHTVCKIYDKFYTLCVKLHLMCKITHCKFHYDRFTDQPFKWVAQMGKSESGQIVF